MLAYAQGILIYNKRSAFIIPYFVHFLLQHFLPLFSFCAKVIATFFSEILHLLLHLTLFPLLFQLWNLLWEFTKLKYVTFVNDVRQIILKEIKRTKIKLGM